MRIALATDAWLPQVNGVVRTLNYTRDELTRLGHEVLAITPEGRRSFPCPTYPEIRLSLFQGRAIARQLDEFQPDCIHIATEGPLGGAVRRYCLRRGLPFTTSWHTQFPEYLRARAPIPLSWSYAWLRRFHAKAARTMAPTPAIRDRLIARGFDNVVVWTRGVDTVQFTPDEPHAYDLPRPIWLNVGRVAVEKNIGQFLELDLPGSKVIVGDGPDRERLEREYPDCHFVGYRFGKELASYIAGADVFVFPSRTDTFGLVMLEAMACGLPVAALPVTGPIDVVKHGETGMLDNDLGKACMAALDLDRTVCRRYAETKSWKVVAEQYFNYLERIEPGTAQVVQEN